MIFTGDSPVNGIKPAIDQMAELIEVEVSEGRNVTLVNHSFGGSVESSGAKGYTEQNPSRLKEGYGRVIGIFQVRAFTPPDTHLSTCRGLENMVAYFTTVIPRDGRYLRTGTI